MTEEGSESSLLACMKLKLTLSLEDLFVIALITILILGQNKIALLKRKVQREINKNTITRYGVGHRARHRP